MLTGKPGAQKWIPVDRLKPVKRKVARKAVPVAKPKTAPPAPKAVSIAKPQSLTPAQKAELKAAEFAKKEAARQKAREAIKQAEKRLSMDTAGLLDALKKADSPIVRTPVKEKVFGRTGIDPVPLFEKNTENLLGRGAFGTAVRTPKGVAKRGFIAPAETKALKALEGTGVTPKLLGESYTQEKAGKGTFSISTRKGTILMSEMKGASVHSQIANMSAKAKQDAFDGLLKSRAKVHRAGVAHNDMHMGNVLWDSKTKTMNILDLGLARIDERAALIEALGTKRGRVAPFGAVEAPGDYQSQSLFRALNPKNQSASKSAAWKRFVANRKKVEAEIAKDGLAEEFSGASIRTLPRGISKGMTKARAKQLIDMLYEGIE